ncbi:hypothetical protein L6R52_03605 [Myxococcota bacterium]|nr:hypothetical protein [Myxococcota bacterium]
MRPSGFWWALPSALACALAVTACGAQPGSAGDAAGVVDAAPSRDAAALDGASDRPDASTPIDATPDAADDAGDDAGGDAGVRDVGAPDAGPRARIAFSRRAGSTSDLVVIELDGTGAEPLTHDAAENQHPAWSPDGRHIAFSSSRSGRYAIWILDVATKTATVVTEHLPVAHAPVFSPDGRRLAFHGRTSVAEAFDVYAVDVAGGAPVRLTTSSANDTGPAWSIDGRSIYFASNRSGSYELWVMDADGASPRVVTSGARIVGRTVVTPDGSSLVFASGDVVSTQIVRFDLATAQLAPLTTGPDAEPHVSPDGRWLVFTTTRFSSTNPELMVLELASPSTGPLRLTNTAATVEGMAAIGPVVP